MDRDAPPPPRRPKHPQMLLRLPHRMSRWAPMSPFSRAVDDDMGDIDDGEVLDEDEQEAALRLVERLAAKLAANITDAAEWEEKEG
uniref:Uncharacterized protein n=1 Tax=Peronospora matthiolae TaxID=2874970 RepID=A0AAV1TZ17_9STRA